MRLTFYTIILLCSIALVEANTYPQLDKYVTDNSDVLTTDEIQQLNLLAKVIEDRTTVEIAILTTPTTNNEDRVLYANHVGEQNGVGKAATDSNINPTP